METQSDRETVNVQTFESAMPKKWPKPSLNVSFCLVQFKHLFVHIGQSNPGYSDPLLESIDVRQIYDKFSEKKGGLKELYEKGPHNAFFLVKFWVQHTHPMSPASYRCYVLEF